jgi:DNA primase
MPGIDYRRLRARISMRDVLTLLGFQPTRVRGAQVRGPCPLHGESQHPTSLGRHGGRASASFSAHLEKHIYRCFVCGAHGNQLDLWAAAQRLPLHAAALNLCQAAQLDPPGLNDSNP